MTLSLLPALIILLSVGVVCDFYASIEQRRDVRDDQPSIESLRPGFGIELNAQRRGFPQAEALLCLADSGCWYTRFADNECPSVDITQSLVRTRTTHLGACACGT